MVLQQHRTVTDSSSMGGERSLTYREGELLWGTPETNVNSVSTRLK